MSTQNCGSEVPAGPQLPRASNATIASCPHRCFRHLPGKRRVGTSGRPRLDRSPKRPAWLDQGRTVRGPVPRRIGGSNPEQESQDRRAAIILFYFILFTMLAFFRCCSVRSKFLNWSFDRLGTNRQSFSRGLVACFPSCIPCASVFLTHLLTLPTATTLLTTPPPPPPPAAGPLDRRSI